MRMMMGWQRPPSELHRRLRIVALVGVVSTAGAAALLYWRRRKLSQLLKAPVEPSVDVPEECALPGKQRVMFRSFGCSHNSADGQTMMGLLRDAGYVFVDSIEECDIGIINSCTVKNPSEDACVNLVRRLHGLGKRAVVTGCVPQADRDMGPDVEGASLLGVTQIARIVEVVEETAQGRCVKLLRRAQLPSLDLPKIRRNDLIEIIPISSGCLGSCTYCKTKAARGKLQSYRPELISHAMHTAVASGAHQIWLTAEDTGAYGLDIGTDIACLLPTLTDGLDMLSRMLNVHVMMRMGMTNPPFILKHVDEVSRFLRHRHVFEFIHIPVQSGSDRTLRDMRREYTVDEFVSLVETLRLLVPGVSIATDIICGFPTETAADHQATLDLLKALKFTAVNISQFYPRPKTPAAAMKRVPTQVVKSRTREVTRLFESYRSFDDIVGQRVAVWFSEHSNRSNHTVGHTKQYVKVLVDRNELLLGTRHLVDVVDAKKWHVVGVVVV
eukprot:Polyplicarium_translucidae@DN1851_c0_g1_i1.p1